MASRLGKRQQTVLIDLENWMGRLPDNVTQIPLIYISIPGSHFSFTYSLKSSNAISPDSLEIARRASKWCGAIAKRIILNWSQGQRLDVISQLLSGIRYFDVKLVLKGSQLVITNGLYGGSIQEFLQHINFFLESHRKEVVILDFQNFYEFNQQLHRKVISMLVEVFGSKICQRQRRMRENTLQTLWELNNQVLIIYRSQMPNDFVWPTTTWVNPWPNKIKINDLIEYLERGLKSRKEDCGHISQAVLTPTTKYVSTHLFSSLKALSKNCNQRILPWLQTKNSGAHGINVVVCDFVDSVSFSETVILLNYKGRDQRDVGGYEAQLMNPPFGPNQNMYANPNPPMNPYATNPYVNPSQTMGQYPNMVGNIQSQGSIQYPGGRN